MPSKETVNLARHLSRPSFLVHASSHWMRFSGRLLMRKFDALFKTTVYKSAYYPIYLRAARSRGGLGSYNKGFLRSMEKDAGTHSTCASDKVSINIKLATIEFISNGIPDWYQTFEDQENIFSLHRWGWLLMAAVEKPSIEIKQYGIKVMQDWFLKMNPTEGHYAWESYSISERTVNALLFFYVLRDFKSGDEEDIDLIENSLIKMAERLMMNLEFHGVLTNNHILNNARALYVLGRLSSCKILADAGRMIFENETPKMITADGFLREDSSIYQLLILRTYLEVLWAARLTGDDEFALKIEGVARSMVKASWELNIYDSRTGKWILPLIGDVTPDFPVEWINNICRSGPALELYRPEGCEEEETGWNKIFSGSDIAGKRAKSPERVAVQKRFFNGSGWYRADYDDLVVIWHVNKYGSVPVYSHGHNDIFSFVLYWKGRPVFIDPGRFNYVHDGLGLYSKEARAHNTFIMDGFEPYPLTKYIYPPRYRKGESEVTWKERPDGLIFKISHDGFQRLGNDCKAFREFDISYGSIKVTDSIQGSGIHNVKTFFQISGDIETAGSPASTEEIDLRANGISAKIKISAAERHSLTILSGIREPEPAGWSFPAYGKALPAKTCIVKARSKFPYKADYSIKFRE